MGEMADYYTDWTRDPFGLDEDLMTPGRWEQEAYQSMMCTRPTRLPWTWVNKDGVILQIAEMSNTHLRNTINFLRRNAVRGLEQRVALGKMSVEELPNFFDVDERALAAWGEVYHELMEEALFRACEVDCFYIVHHGLSEDGFHLDLHQWMRR